jgi:hypothetical protein
MVPSFTFLGFSQVWGRSRTGKNVVRQVTAKNRYARALAAVTAWCRVNRHQSIPDQHAHLTAMMRGHYAYYGITGNFRRISWYARQVATIWQKWLSRRDRRGRFSKTRFSALLRRHPLPAARIVHRYIYCIVEKGSFSSGPELVSMKHVAESATYAGVLASAHFCRVEKKLRKPSIWEDRDTRASTLPRSSLVADVLADRVLHLLHVTRLDRLLFFNQKICAVTSVWHVLAI